MSARLLKRVVTCPLLSTFGLNWEVHALPRMRGPPGMIGGEVAGAHPGQGCKRFFQGTAALEVNWDHSGTCAKSPWKSMGVHLFFSFGGSVLAS